MQSGSLCWQLTGMVLWTSIQGHSQLHSICHQKGYQGLEGARLKIEPATKWANTCAYTDRVVEHVFEKAEEIKKLHEDNFKEDKE